MPRRIRLLPYRRGSVSARALADAADVLRLNMRRTTQFRGRDNDIIVNWGYSHSIPEYNRWFDGRVRWINPIGAVHLARDKRRALERLCAAGVPTLEYTVDIVTAQQWVDAGHVVVQRNTATGQGGAGIVVLDPTLTVNAAEQRAPSARSVRATGHGVLWTKYFKRNQEFRIHVWGPDVIDIQLKKKRNGATVDTRIRSYDNGWVFCRQGVASPQCVTEAAVAAVRALGLDFGAVDIGYNHHYRRPAVFEVNTAPGIEGTTVEHYANKIKELRRAP